MNKYKLLVMGKGYKYFLNTLIHNKIKLYLIEEDKNRLIIIVDKEDFNKIKKIKTSCKIKVLNRYGVEKIKYLEYKYRYLLLFFILSLFFLIFLSNIIFKVEVIHPKEEIRDLIYSDLDKLGLKKYSFVISYNKKEFIKRKILNLEKDKIEWLEIDRIGTKYVVNVEERKKKKTDSDNTPRNIIAKKDCMILEINSSKGEILHKKYDYVKGGDIIVSGTIKNKKKEVSKIKAEGTIYGEVWYKVGVEVPIKYREEKLTGKTKKVLTFKFLNSKLSLEFKKYQNYSFNYQKLFVNQILPIGVLIEEKKEKIVKEKEYNINNVDSFAIKLAESKFKKRDIISEKVLKKILNNSTIKVEIFLKVREDVTSFQIITDLSLKEDVE